MTEAKLYEIYDILDNALNEELEKIVEILTKTDFSYLKHCRPYILNNPDHRAYRDQIADEIYRLGFWMTEGLTTPVGSMGRKKPRYADLLAVACKQIGIPTGSSDIARREELLLNVFATQHVSTVQPEARAALISEAAGAAGKAAAGMLGTEAWQPFVAALIEISQLRQMMAADGRLSGSHGAVEAATSVESTQVVNVVGDDGQHAFLLATISQEQAQGWTFMVPDGRTVSKLTPFFQALQPFFNAEQMLAGKYIYSSEIALSWSDKMGAFVGVAKGRQGMVDLRQVTALGISGPAIFITAATAIAHQQQMQRIEGSLDEIKAMLADVSRFQQDERRSILTGSIRYFRQVARAVLSGELAPEVLHMLEYHEAELVKILDHLVKDLRAATEAMRAVKKDAFGSSRYIKSLQNAQVTVTSRYNDILLCLRARACGFQLMSAYPGREAGKQARFDAIIEDFRPFLPDGEATLAIDQVLREKLRLVSSYEDRLSLLDSENTLLENIANCKNDIFNSISLDFSSDIKSGDKHVIDFQVEAGEVVGVRLR